MASSPKVFLRSAGLFQIPVRGLQWIVPGALCRGASNSTSEQQTSIGGRYRHCVVLGLWGLTSCATTVGTHRALSGTNWGVSGGEASCAPADLRDTEIRKIKDPVFKSTPVAYQRQDIDGVPVYEVSEGAGIEYEDRLYSLRLVRIVSPSEHRIGGMSFLMEIQLYSVAGDGTPLAVSILVHKGEARPALAAMFRSATGTLALKDLLPAFAGYYTYEGNLPTHPCSGVRWLVMRSGLEASPEDVDEYLKRWTVLQRSLNPPVRKVQESE